VPVVQIWRDGSAWLSTRRGGHRRLHYQEGQGSNKVSSALVSQLQAALEETGSRTVLVQGDRTLSMDRVAPLLAAVRRAGADDHAMSLQLAQAQTQGGRVRPEPPILTVTAQGNLLLANRVVTLANLEEHLRRELAWREQDTLFLRGDRVQRDFPGVTAIAKRAGARAVGVLDEKQAVLLGENIYRPFRAGQQPPVLTVTREGVLYLDRVPVTADKLEEHLRFALTSRGEDTLLIRGDKAQLFDTAVDVMAIAKRAGARNVGVLSADAVAPAPRSSTGTLDPALLAREVRSHMPDIRRCYETALAAKPGLSGRIVLKFTVAADGQVETPSLGESTLGSPQAESCVVELARSWRFPAPEGGPVEAEFPFVFASKGD
jgi:TonB family protein